MKPPFNIAGAGVQTIIIGSTLQITDTVTINGYSQPGASANTLAVGNNAVLRIELNGNNGGFNGLTLGAGSDGSVIRGLVINRFGQSGIQVSTTGNLIAGNWIGTNSAGTADLGNTLDGITISANNNTIGGSAPADRNVISGNNDEGIDVDATYSGNVIIGNYIGTNATGTAGIGNGSGSNAGGVLIDSANNRVGGTGAGEGNIIAFNNQFGVFLGSGAGAGNALLGNSIFSNTGLGIDLGNNGVTVNDPGDGDSGANDLLNFPIVTKVVQNGANLDITMVLDVPAGTYRIELFENPAGIDSSRHGEGRSSSMRCRSPAPAPVRRLSPAP